MSGPSPIGIKRTLAITALAMTISLAAPSVTVEAAQQPDIASQLKGGLAGASDNALDQLSQPGAFYADEAIRILLPGGKTVSRLMQFGSKTGLTKDFTRSLNDAAGLAAQEAKPIFRDAINDLSISDVPRLVSKKDGGTRYLRESSGDQLRLKMRPLVVAALGDVGAYDEMEKLSLNKGPLSRLGMNSDSLTDHVTDKALDGIYDYIGREEAKLRDNPIDTGKKLLDIFGG